jgi:hypothetical protein
MPVPKGVFVKRTPVWESVIVICTIAAGTAFSQDHFVPGAANIRDWSVPGPGLYGALYNHGLLTTSLNTASGNPLTSVTITGPNGRTATSNVSTTLRAYSLNPMFV